MYVVRYMQFYQNYSTWEALIFTALKMQQILLNSTSGIVQASFKLSFSDVQII